MTSPRPNTANRLALGLMAARGIGYAEAIDKLEQLTLRLVCDGNVSRSSALQAALLTAVNCGRRAFLGGVRIEMPENIPLLVPWPGITTLNEAVKDLQAEVSAGGDNPSQTIFLGFHPEEEVPHGLVVQATGWRGGIEPLSKKSLFRHHGGNDFALGGIFAAGLAVHRGFLRATAISIFACDESAGISFWDQNADWLSDESEGPPLRALPQGLWMLGLGHLGQAFIWTLGLLPYSNTAKCELMLQDFDSIEKPNVGSGLLSGDADIGSYKTRLGAGWLESRGFRARVCERPFDETTVRRTEEPAIALCGFDTPEPRRLLEGANFCRVIECGLGGSIHDFDLIHVHNFPGSRTAASLWEDSAKAVVAPNSILVEALSAPGEVCGALAIETAGKSVSTSFVGVMAAATVFGELLRAFNKGSRYDEIYLSPRNLADCHFAASAQPYTSTEIAAAGFCEVALQHGRDPESGTPRGAIRILRVPEESLLSSCCTAKR